MDKLFFFLPMHRRHGLATMVVLVFALFGGPAMASEEAPDAFIQRITTESLNAIKSDKA